MKSISPILFLSLLLSLNVTGGDLVFLATGTPTPYRAIRPEQSFTFLEVDTGFRVTGGWLGGSVVDVYNTFDPSQTPEYWDQTEWVYTLQAAADDPWNFVSYGYYITNNTTDPSIVFPDDIDESVVYFDVIGVHTQYSDLGINKVLGQTGLLYAYNVTNDSKLLPAPLHNEQSTNYPAGFGSYSNDFWSLTLGNINTWVTTNYVDSGSPEIYEWTRTADAGDTVVLTGGGITSGVTDLIVYDADGTFYFAQPQLFADNQFAFTLRGELANNRMYWVLPRNGENYGQSFPINQTESWWVGPDKVAAGDTFSVFGRNLELGDDGLTQLWIDGYGWVTNTAANPYKVDFICPAIGTGTYDIYIHNGHGGKYGWAEGLSLTVESDVDWSSGTTTSMSYYAATTAGFEQALADVGVNGTVTVPAGTYYISSQLDIPSYRRLIGDDRATTILQTSASFTWGLYTQGKTDIEIRDLTIKSGAYNNTALINAKGNDLLIANVTVDQTLDPTTSVGSIGDDQTTPAISVGGGDYVTISNCHIITRSPVWVDDPAKQVFFKDTHFQGQYHPNALIKFEGEQYSITGCTASPYDTNTAASGWTRGRFMDFNGGNHAIQKVYIGGCTTTNLGPDTANQAGVGTNHGEQINIEGGAASYEGIVISATSNTVTLASSYGTTTNLNIVITGGTGIGQCRRIAGASGTLITVDRNWTIQPENGSLVTIGRFVTKMAIYNNVFEGMQANVDVNNDSMGSDGVHFYSGTFGNVVDGNTFRRTKSGTELWAGDMGSSTSDLAMPCYFNVFQNNTYTNNRFSIEMQFGDWEVSGGRLFRESNTHLGNVLRGNDIRSVVGKAIQYSSCEAWSAFGLNVFDNNTINGAPEAIDYSYDNHPEWSWPIATATSNQLFIGNTFTNVTTNIDMGNQAGKVYFKNHTTDGINTGGTGGIITL